MVASRGEGFRFIENRLGGRGSRRVANDGKRDLSCGSAGASPSRKLPVLKQAKALSHGDDNQRRPKIRLSYSDFPSGMVSFRGRSCTSFCCTPESAAVGDNGYTGGPDFHFVVESCVDNRHTDNSRIVASLSAVPEEPLPPVWIPKWTVPSG